MSDRDMSEEVRAVLELARAAVPAALQRGDWGAQVESLAELPREVRPLIMLWRQRGEWGEPTPLPCKTLQDPGDDSELLRRLQDGGLVTEQPAGAPKAIYDALRDRILYLEGVWFAPEQEGPGSETIELVEAAPSYREE